MIGHLVYAAGSPCPTFVLDARLLPDDQDTMLAALTEARRYLHKAGGAHVLKIALVQPSEHPMFDLDYRFVQALPGQPDRFDTRGSCGHSILSAVVAAARAGMTPKLTASTRTRVNVLNNGDSVVCEVDSVDRDQAVFRVYFIRSNPIPHSELLLSGAARQLLAVDGEHHEVSLVSSGNAYAFVDARSLGVDSSADLFAAGHELFDKLTRIRRAAAGHLGWSPDGAFPKVAAVLPAGAGQLAVRAVSVPTWHPTVALTGAACIGAATQIHATIPWQALREGGGDSGPVEILTPGGRTTVTAVSFHHDGKPALAWTSVGGKRVTFQGSFLLEPLAHLQFKEVAQCLALSATST